MSMLADASPTAVFHPDFVDGNDTTINING